MSDARKCDVCGDFFTIPIYYTYEGGPYLAHISPITNDFTQEYDLCPSCSYELMNWIDARKDAFYEKEKNDD